MIEFLIIDFDLKQFFIFLWKDNYVKSFLYFEMNMSQKQCKIDNFSPNERKKILQWKETKAIESFGEMFFPFCSTNLMTVIKNEFKPVIWASKLRIKMRNRESIIVIWWMLFNDLA